MGLDATTGRMNATAPRGVDLSVVIVTHDSAGVIEPCLASISAAAADLVVEVIVVDNASTDGTPEIVARHGHATLVANTDTRGFAAGCNVGIAAGRGRHLLVLNTDTVLPPGALPALLSALERFPDVGLVGSSSGGPRSPSSTTAEWGLESSTPPGDTGSSCAPPGATSPRSSPRAAWRCCGNSSRSYT